MLNKLFYFIGACGILGSAACTSNAPDEPGAQIGEADKHLCEMVAEYYASVTPQSRANDLQVNSVSRRVYQIQGDTVVEVIQNSRAALPSDSVFEIAFASFNINGNEGFTFLSEDADINRMLVFTENATVSDTSRIGGLRYLVENLPLIAMSIKKDQQSVSRGAVYLDRFIDPIVKYRWHQRYPFNMYAPYYKDGSGQVPIGCGAVAAAMTIATVGRFHGTYYATYNMDFPNLPKYSSAAAPTAQDVKLGQFLHEVAVGCQTKYTAEGGGTTLEALAQYFKDLNYKTIVQSKEIVLTALVPRLVKGIPHIMRGEGSYGGHAWIVDGYNSKQGKDEVHCLWGWDYAHTWVTAGAYTDGTHDFSKSLNNLYLEL